MFLDGESVSLAEVKQQVRPFLAARYPDELEESPAAAPEEGRSTDVLAGDLEGEANGDLTDLTGFTDLGS